MLAASEEIRLFGDESHKLSLSDIAPDDPALAKAIVQYVRRLERLSAGYEITRAELEKLRVNYAVLQERDKHRPLKEIALLMIGAILGLMPVIHQTLGTWATVVAGVFCCLLAVPVLWDLLRRDSLP
jgi:hypothetical protein